MTVGPAATPVRDPWSGRAGYVAGARAHRPSTAEAACPFCPGGREADPELRGPFAFANRWPPIAGDLCEVVVHTERHEGSFADLPSTQTRAVVDLWAERSRALAARPEVRCVLVFENRGAEAGATVAHPHSQIFGLPDVPQLLDAGPGQCLGCADAAARLEVAGWARWRSEVPSAPLAPYTLRLVPRRHVGTLDELDDDERDGLAECLRDAVRRLDALFALEMPYHLWIRQGHDGRRPHLYVQLAGLRRSAERLRILGAAEVATGLFFTPLDPGDAAAGLREAYPSDGRPG